MIVSAPTLSQLLSCELSHIALVLQLSVHMYYVACLCICTINTQTKTIFPAFTGVDPLGPHLAKKKTDIAAIASVLKQYFRDLDEPLFPVEKYHEFVESARKCVTLDYITVHCCRTK